MNELKAYTFSNMEGRGLTEYYFKSEADKVISELKQRLALVNLVQRLNQPEALYSDLETMGRLSHEIGVVARRERHHKYKRCLAMAEWCVEAYNRECGLNPEEMTNKEFYKQQIEFWPRWEQRWLAIAEKFKPNSTAQ